MTAMDDADVEVAVGRFLSVAGHSTRDAARSFWPDLVGLAGHSFNSGEHRETVVQYQKRATQCVLVHRASSGRRRELRRGN